MAEKTKLTISIVELIAYIVGGLLALWGLVYIILGSVCTFLSYNAGLVVANNALREGTNGMGFLEQGILVMVIGVAVVAVFLLVYAKTADREFEKQQRRAAARFNRKNKDATTEETIVEVETEPAE